MPGLFPQTAGSARVANSVNEVCARRLKQLRVGLFVVPQIRVAAPQSLLQRQQTGFEPALALQIAALQLQRKSFDEHGALRKVPAALELKTDFGISWQRDEAFLGRMIGP